MDINNLGLGTKLAAVFNFMCEMVAEVFAVVFDFDPPSYAVRNREEEERMLAPGQGLTISIDKRDRTDPFAGL